jgi:hypothetical protein
MLSLIMTWLAAPVVVLIAAVAAVTRIKPKGTWPAPA